MRILSDEMKNRFATGSTLCACWKLTSKSGEQSVLATDHDQPVEFRGETYLPGLALTSSSLRQTLSLSPEPLDLEGALSADGLSEADLRAGVWDGANVEIYHVDWAAPQHGLWMWGGYLTEISEAGQSFSVRLASKKSDLERTVGRVFARRCDAEFGDARCGVDVESAPQPRCDKRFATCRDVFSNAARFCGFPHMPGNDAVISGPGEKRDGSSREIER
ncbi:DUF2163 domain-containing protein [Ponticaulis sp.]|uniref:DUF2163 domain-containing protein n=1 Tax=Ponticaulis sp. TaxID=2020902 RepID=UPI000B6A84E2|nr:DUF2163 domain-containing protein [Ponticaulis sp.]MAI90412.1 hypothetical protein [Ponticaulis sp.]OUY00114.1 MAG: hypothetical protein CBB65_08230 [Hyphomonadaceae bacterium TMED5]|tara:strand:+ start:22967 stop:23623 length:657 start_codon:yes stop_codon:yes gene_type:complete